MSHWQKKPRDLLFVKLSKVRYNALDEIKAAFLLMRIVITSLGLVTEKVELCYQSVIFLGFHL